MIERVARALADYLTGGEMGMKISGDPEKPHQIIEVWRDYVPAARAAISAMREPTQAMLDALNREALCEGEITSGWQSAIDEAIK